MGRNALFGRNRGLPESLKGRGEAMISASGIFFFDPGVRGFIFDTTEFFDGDLVRWISRR